MSREEQCSSIFSTSYALERKMEGIVEIYIQGVSGGIGNIVGGGGMDYSE
jgi:hypothetical protein